MLYSIEHEISIAHKMKKKKIKTLSCCIYPAHKYYNANWHFKIYEQDKFHASGLNGLVNLSLLSCAGCCLFYQTEVSLYKNGYCLAYKLAQSPSFPVLLH